MVMNHIKPGDAVTFMKYLASRVSLIILPKALTYNKMVLLASNLLRLAELMVNEMKKTIFKNIYHYSCLHPIYHCLM